MSIPKQETEPDFVVSVAAIRHVKSGRNASFKANADAPKIELTLAQMRELAEKNPVFRVFGEYVDNGIVGPLEGMGGEAGE